MSFRTDVKEFMKAHQLKAYLNQERFTQDGVSIGRLQTEVNELRIAVKHLNEYVYGDSWQLRDDHIVDQIVPEDIIGKVITLRDNGVDHTGPCTGINRVDMDHGIYEIAGEPVRGKLVEVREAD
jgi:hypothetical protein